jgi:PIN domain nuclease of toxin-antitoxin system
MSVAEASFRFTEFGYAALPLETVHVVAAEGLPAIHHDPFDRMLVAQAQIEQIRLLTQDAELGAYGASVLLY